MGAICAYCKGDMLAVEGCTFTHFLVKGKVFIERSLDWQKSGVRCHDCGAMGGQLHHPGCDSERCPICEGQAFACSCLKGAQLAIKK